METNLRTIPAVGVLINAPSLAPLIETHGRELVTWAVREELSAVREAVGRGRKAPSSERIAERARSRVQQLTNASLVRVINATGIVLHTNLGRAPLGTRILEDIAPIVEGYSNTEFDLATGRRGHRVDHIKPLIPYLTGAEDALVVNNNAAALILVLHYLARGKEAIISRGELIEIGGSFRIPDIMRAAGTKMVEVGTTNRTRLSDFEAALTPKTAVIIKAHKSNYSIHGFTEEPSAAELARFAREHALPFVYDIGSGLLRTPKGLRVADEPDVRGALDAGADLVTFSGDKLLGGPQAGIVVGTKALVSRLAKAPLMRALRVGKLTLAALGSACRQYLDNESLVHHNPAFAIFEQSSEIVRDRAERLRERLAADGIGGRVVTSVGRSGGGALPDLRLDSFAFALEPPTAARAGWSDRIHRRLMACDTPVVGVMREGALILDMFCVRNEELETLLLALSGIVHRT